MEPINSAKAMGQRSVSDGGTGGMGVTDGVHRPIRTISDTDSSLSRGLAENLPNGSILPDDPTEYVMSVRPYSLHGIPHTEYSDWRL